MVVLKKVRASTLMETLVATVLIVVVFMLTSMILNNLFSNTIKNDSTQIDAHLNKLEYLYSNSELQLPYQDTIDDWEILIDKPQGNDKIVTFEAVNLKTNKTLTRSQFETN